MFEEIIQSIRDIQQFPFGPVPLHAPVFQGKEKEYVLDTLESTFVSSVGQYVDRLERMLEDITGARRAVACANGTVALEMALRLAGVGRDDLVVTQPLSFVATANAIHHTGATPVFVDIDENDLGMSPEALLNFLENNCTLLEGCCCLRDTGRRVAACVPMHSFGLPCRIAEIAEICREWNIPLVEDAAEALGSFWGETHCGLFGQMGVLSFNGNKIVTTGGGGAVITNDEELGKRLKHLTTTAKIPHPWEYRHDAPAWNFRLPNLNAALGCAQLEQLAYFLEIKRLRARRYVKLFADTNWTFVEERAGVTSNYWLCVVLTRNRAERDAFLAETNQAGLMTRPAWEPLHSLPMYSGSLRDCLAVTGRIVDRLVNLPSGVGTKTLGGMI